MITNPDDPENNDLNNNIPYNNGMFYNPMMNSGFNMSPFPPQFPQPIPEHISKKEEADRWKNRRRMAWIALIAIFIAIVLLFFIVPVPRLDLLSSVTEWFFIVMGTIISTYIGSTTYSEIVEMKVARGR